MGFSSDFKKLEKIDREISLLHGVSSLLHWDQATLMKSEGLPNRSMQYSHIQSLIHGMITSKELKLVVKKLHGKNSYSKLNSTQKKIVDKYYKNIKKIERIPLKHVEEFSKLASTSYAKWEDAKKKKDYNIFKPYLKKIIDMKLKEAKYINRKEHPYNVFLDDFEEGMKMETVDAMFAELKEGLLRILSRIKKSDSYKKQKTLPKQIFSSHDKKLLAEDISHRILGDEEQYILSESAHPFTTTIGYNDVRITTRYDDNNAFFFFYAAMHEAGHALYELGFDEKLKYTILHHASSMGLHESQSHFWEDHVGKSKAFLKYYYKNLSKHSNILKRKDYDWLYKNVNRVKPGLIRVTSDELTYNIHILIRFELEKALLEKKISVENLPKEWNKKYKEYLGVTPPNDAVGVLQDMHWSDGSFGYFPTYTLGCIYAAMLADKMEEEISLSKHICKGDFHPISCWLKEKIHRHGSSFLTNEVMRKATGKDLDVKAYLSYLEKKYYGIYNIKRA